MTVEEFIAGQARSMQLLEGVCFAMEAIGPTETRVTRSQIAFHRRVTFAWVWMPGKYLQGRLPLFSLSPSAPDAPRWKEIVEPAPGRCTHHLELYAIGEIDDEVPGLAPGGLVDRRLTGGFCGKQAKMTVSLL